MSFSLTHIALHVDDVEACISFYHRYAGMRVASDQERGGRRMVLLSFNGRESGFVIQLIGGGEDTEVSIEKEQHIGIAADSRAEVDDIVTRGREEGILIYGPDDADFPTGYFCWLKDPNGNHVEFSYGHLLPELKV